MRIFSGYKGSSFFELLKLDSPHLLPDFSVGEGIVQVPHGTTVLACKYEGGVLMAGDRLATMGNQVASRDVEKVFRTDSHSVMAISGAAGPSVEMARLLLVELEHYEKIEGEQLELEGKANKLSQMVRQNLPAAMQGLAVVPLFAGFDTRRKAGRLWKFDITGGRYEETDFDATGSGGLFARESLKKRWSPGLDRDASVRAAVEALSDAADEDRATGGVDLERGIFPVIMCAQEDGIAAVDEGEIESVYRALHGSRQRGKAKGNGNGESGGTTP